MSGEPTVGRRVECAGYRGTVRFVGDVPPTKEMWLGVEWDDPSRGRHDGSHNGTQYFKTKHPTAGSFVRPDKVFFGISCADAIRSRYGKIDGQTAGVDAESLKDLQRDMKAKFLEVVGFDKVNEQQSQFEHLQVVGLSSCGVNSAGEEEELAMLCPHIRELDLSQNLLSSWEAVAKITEQLCELKLLNLSVNRLRIPQDAQKLAPAFRNVQHLILRQMEYTWTDILSCANMWPHISHLQVPCNKINYLLPPPREVFSELKSLDLQENDLWKWENVCQLGKLPKLESLNLTSTSLEDINFPDAQPGQKTCLFRSLKQINLSNNKLDRWECFSELDKLKSLDTIRIVKNPILQTEKPETTQQLIIARIGGLVMLNGSPISARERRDCELDYLKKYGIEWLEAKRTNTLDLFEAKHPRFNAIVKKHGAPEDSEFNRADVSMKKSLITLHISCVDSDSPPVTKKVPSTMLVQKLQGLVQRLFRTPNEPSLSYVSSKNSQVKIPLDNPLRELGFFSVSDGDTLLVQWH